MTTTRRQPTVLHVITWNVQRARAERARAQAEWLAARPESDVLVLTEVQDSAGGRALAAALEQHGYSLIAAEPCPGAYGVLIAARMGRVERAQLAVAPLPQRLVAARLRLDRCTVGLVGLYVPSRGPAHARNCDKRAFQAEVSSLLPTLAAALDCTVIVVAGDLNVVERGHSPHYRVFGDWEYGFYAAFAQHGFVDAFRELRPYAIEHSWFGRGGNGYRFDHMFVSHQHRALLTDCRYLQEPRLAALSDHAAMTMSLDLGAR